MSIPISNSVSGINAALEMQSASADNVSNANTDGYKSKVATTEETKNGGVKVTISQNDQPGQEYVNGYGRVAERSNVDYARERVNQINARQLLAANVASLKTYQEMSDALLDIIA